MLVKQQLEKKFTKCQRCSNQAPETDWRTNATPKFKCFEHICGHPKRHIKKLIVTTIPLHE